MPELDALFYSHTHSPEWEIDGLKEIFAEYKKAGVPTISVHLDIWRGLQRESDVGREATWSCEYVFTADGSPETQKLYESYGVNHHYLPAGIKESSCYIAEPDRKRFPQEIIFVGSRNYHPEWPHRPQLIDWLAEVYGDRFGHYGGDGLGVIREHDLNVLYSSAKIAVGDSCFAGERERYMSDRQAETQGRHGFLIHPEIPGVDIPGMATWKVGDFLELREKIDYFLEQSEPREYLRDMGYDYVKKHQTYTNHAETILQTVFPSGVPETT